MMKTSRWFVLLLNLVLIAGCAAQPPAEQATATPVQPVAAASATLVQAVATATETPAPDLTALCPFEKEGTTRYVSTLVAQPWDAEKFPQALPDVEQLWNMANASIAFFDQWH